ncbi:hypothetical protein Leryth_022895 [Lithospermum erythrorhizon]|nr:hypothetical protein Leryth_022895 [Lithospermum erythrorhizon]
MGCISSKQAEFDACHSPLHHDYDDNHRHFRRSINSHHHHHHPHSSSGFKNREEGKNDGGPGIKDSSLFNIGGGLGKLEKIREEPEDESERENKSNVDNSVITKSKSPLKGEKSEKRIAFSIKFGRVTEGEHAPSGWPIWLSAVAGEAIQGWLPLKSDSFERLEKIGQGTYSSVYRARDLDTGKMVALKKVRFDNFQPESVRFMAKEITILRSLDHPNIMKLEGIITSKSSCNIYLVFEYMEHDLSGLISCPDIKFSESEIKCYMKQLLSGIEYCHSHGIMHRDIKSSNILVNNDGILKIADFGLATFLSLKHKQPLTSRVVTLWYRPPELLMGSTSYGATVDLWSTGCVFAELFIGRPLFKGRTEVEQLHKIFKLCGSPSDEYFRRSKLPLASMFKPQQPYESMLRERCKELPSSAVNLIETFLSIEPYKRGTASMALESGYFTTKPYACDPSSIPKYPPNKEIDAKFREDARRKYNGTSQASGVSRNSRRVRKALQEPRNSNKVPIEEIMQRVRRSNGGASGYRGRGSKSRTSMKGPYDTLSDASQMTEESQNDSIVTVPAQMSVSTSLNWGKRAKHDSPSSRLYSQPISRSQQFERRDPYNMLNANDEIGQRLQLDDDSNQLQDSSKDYMDQQRGKNRSGTLPARSRRPDTKQDGEPRAPVRRSRFYID